MPLPAIGEFPAPPASLLTWHYHFWQKPFRGVQSRLRKFLSGCTNYDVDVTYAAFCWECGDPCNVGASLSDAGTAGLAVGDTLEATLRGKMAPPDDAFVRCAAACFSAFVADRDATKALLSERDQLLAKLLALQQENAPPDEPFYPDANSCLRLSAGHVEGYQAADAVLHTPVTTLAGLLEKHDDSASMEEEQAAEFACPPRLAHLCRTDRQVAGTPVCLLYSTDTVGGNSGSPVLDAEGLFVAINFDRQRLGLMNEFKWSSQYSRSIGTDVRYILWLVGEYDGAQYLVDEMTK